jgi:hypothetical protein
VIGADRCNARNPRRPMAAAASWRGGMALTAGGEVNGVGVEIVLRSLCVVLLLCSLRSFPPRWRRKDGSPDFHCFHEACRRPEAKIYRQRWRPSSHHAGGPSLELQVRCTHSSWKKFASFSGNPPQRFC